MLPEVIAEAARRFGATPAFVEPEGRPLSYAELDRRSDALAEGLLAAGVSYGTVLGLTLPSTTAYVVAYLAAAKVGAITAGVNSRLSPREQQACLDLVSPTLVLGDEAQLAELEARGTGAARAPLPTQDTRPVTIVFTSGTTGTPKGAIFTNAQLAAVTVIDVGGRWGDGTPVPMVTGTEMAHVGFATKLPWYLMTAATLHLLRRWRAAAVLDIVERERLASIGGVAPQIALMLRDPDFDRRDLSSVRQLVVGGGPSPAALVHEARRRFGADYSIRYSSTESGGVGTGTAFDADDHEALHTVGRPRGPVEVDVRDEDGRTVPAGEVGAVHLRSGAVMAGYWDDPAATAEALVGDGWLKTGDLGFLDERGCLVLAGRSKEMYIRGGYNVYPMEVEGVLAQHPGVTQVVVVARPDDVMGEVGVAVVIPADAAAPPSVEDLRAYAADRLAAYKLPDAVAVVDEIPLTAMQKTDRKALTALVAGHGDGGTDHTSGA